MPLRNETVYEPVPSLTFDTDPPDPFDFLKGRVYWDDTDETLAISQNDGDTPVTLQIGQEMQVRVWNDTGSDIPNGAIVHPVGSVAYRPSAALSQADALSTARARGITTQAIPKNTSGFVATFGLIRDIDTQSPGWAEGDFLYLSSTVAGGLQKTPPTSGYCVRCAYVLRKHPEQGIIFFVPEPLPAMGDIAGGNYTQWGFDGTMQSFGDAICYRDELQSVTGARITSPAGDFQQNIAEAAVTAKTSARYPTDYITTNWQLNHDWALGTSIYPHLHWWQTTTNTPNWLLAYRWQKQGSAKTTSWTLLPWTENVFTWEEGTLNQITKFGAIAAPTGYGEVSDIVQIRLYRDYTNVSTEFTGNDPVNADQDFINMDTHIQVDMFGSRSEYGK